VSGRFLGPVWILSSFIYLYYLIIRALFKGDLLSVFQNTDGIDGRRTVSRFQVRARDFSLLSQLPERFWDLTRSANQYCKEIKAARA
jgi:hypothetical protein